LSHASRPFSPFFKHKVLFLNTRAFFQPSPWLNDLCKVSSPFPCCVVLLPPSSKHFLCFLAFIIIDILLRRFLDSRIIHPAVSLV
jgi:hypothetical protein